MRKQLVSQAIKERGRLGSTCRKPLLQESYYLVYSSVGIHRHPDSSLIGRQLNDLPKNLGKIGPPINGSFKGEI